MSINPIQQQGYELLQQGLQELSIVEANGIRIDLKRLEKTKKQLTSKIRQLKEELETSDVWKIWRRQYGTKSSLTSRDQLSNVLHVQLEYEVNETTDSGKASMDEQALQKIDNPFIETLLRYFKCKKAYGTDLKGIEREVMPDNRVRSFFSLHTVVSYRSSSDSPNFQNYPVRDKEISKIIRGCFIASDDCVLVENDFKGAEVCTSAAYHHDKNFISYITTPGKDMHRDMAAQIYMLDSKDVSKDVRYGAKNMFVFPQFYGDYYVSCAKHLWEWVQKGKLTTPDGTSLYEHLASKGIERLGRCDPDYDPIKGTFEKHLQDVERDFWDRRFRAYGQWRRDWFNQYLKLGFFDILTGFRVHGAFNRKQVCNFPIQGSAFHCLLWSLIQINRALRKYKMKSMIVGQIHDSLIGDVPTKELRNYLEIVEDVTTVRLRKHYDWLVVPPEIEYEIVPEGKSWFDKKEVKFKQGRFQHPLKPDRFTSDVEKFMQVLGTTDNK